MSSEIMNVKVVSGSAAGFHINTVTYSERGSFFYLTSGSRLKQCSKDAR